MAARNGGTVYDEEDDVSGRPPGTQQTSAERAAANRAAGANYATNTAQPKPWYEQAGEFLFGNGQDPGLFGTGQYDPGAVSLGGAADREEERRRRMTEVDGRTAPTMDTTRADQFRDQQMTLAGDLLARSRGEGTSVAQQQLRMGTEANLAAGVAAANSVRGPGAAAGAGQMLAQRANMGQQMAGQAALLRAEEVTQAQGLLGQVVGQGRGMDLDTAGQNLAAQQETQRQRDQMVQYLLSQEFSEAEAQMMADLEIKRLEQASYYNTAAAHQQYTRDVAGGIGTAAGYIANGGKKPTP